MFRLTTATKRAIPLTLRRLHHDVPRSGIVFPVEHIDISSAAQRSSLPPKAAAHDAELEDNAPKSPSPVLQAHPVPETHPLPKKSSPPLSVLIQKSAGGPDTKPKTVTVDVNVNLVSVFWGVMGWVVVPLVLFKFWQRWNEASDRVEHAARLIADAPDLAVLQEDPDALAAHLESLMRVLVPPSMGKDFAQALARHRAEGDVGRTAIMETCVRLHEVIQDKDLRRTDRAWKLTVLFAKFVGPERKGQKSVSSVPESTESTDPTWQTDYPPSKG